MKGIYDCLVVGAGPAGGVCAYELAKKGFKVLILEKERLPRPKVCAGGLPVKAPQLLDFDLTLAFETQVWRGVCAFRSLPQVEIDLGEMGGWTVTRANLDHLIVQKAVEAGAELQGRQDVREVEMGPDMVIARTEREEWKGRIIVGADGAKSMVARSLGLLPRRRIAVGLESELPVDKALLNRWKGRILLDFGSIPGGYGWIFPKRDHLSVGVCIGKVSPMGEALRRFVERYQLLPHNGKIRMKGHPVALGGGGGMLHRGRGLLVGDVASLADPFLGEGIFYAMRSAQLAAQVIDEADQAALDLSSYTQLIDTQIRREFRYARLIAEIYYRLPSLGYRLFRGSTIIREGIIKVVQGKMRYGEFFWSVMRDLPRVLSEGLR